MSTDGSILLSLTLVFLLISACAGAESPEKSKQRPRLDNYDDPDRFITDVLAWERENRQNETKAMQDPESEQTSSGREDWHDVNGPETLEGALRKARGYTPPDYDARYRFNRTTHLSFPLPRLEGEQMSGQAITGGLRKEELEQPSLEPLPEMNMILDKIGDTEDFSGKERQETLPTPVENRRKTVQVNTR